MEQSINATTVGFNKLQRGPGYAADPSCPVYFIGEVRVAFADEPDRKVRIRVATDGADLWLTDYELAPVSQFLGYTSDDESLFQQARFAETTLLNAWRQAHGLSVGRLLLTLEPTIFAGVLKKLVS